MRHKVIQPEHVSSDYRLQHHRHRPFTSPLFIHRRTATRFCSIMPQTEARPEIVSRIVKSHHLTIQFPTTLTLSSNHDISIPQLIKKRTRSRDCESEKTFPHGRQSKLKMFFVLLLLKSRMKKCSPSGIIYDAKVTFHKKRIENNFK
jgi:hypothetical protein